MEANFTETERRLRLYEQLSVELNVQSQRLEKLNLTMYSIGSPAITDMPKSPSSSPDKIGKMVCHKMALEEKIYDLEEQLKAEERKITAYAEKYLDAYEKSAIILRYIDRLPWTDVADTIFGEKTDYLDKLDSYQRRVYRLREKAILKLAATDFSKTS